MAIGSISVTRVSHNMQSNTLVSSLQNTQLQLFEDQARLSAGRSFLSPSDDPVAAYQTLELTQTLEQQDQLTRNVGYGDNFLSSADSTLSEYHTLLIDAQNIASQSIGTLSSAEERKAQAELISAIIDQVVNLGNREYQGRYLFAGRDTAQTPFQSALGGTAYYGDDSRITTKVTESSLETISFTGQDVFKAESGRIFGNVDLDPTLTEKTRIETVSGASGNGIRLGTLVVSEEGVGRFDVDLSSADTMGQIVSIFNRSAEEAGAAVRASLSTTGLEITPGGASVTIDDVSTGVVANDLGILTTTPTTAAIAGLDLNPRLTPTTLLADCMGGAGLTLDGEITITNAEQTVVVDLSGTETIQDVLNKISNSELYMKAVINEDGTGIDVINRISGTYASIGENGSDIATKLGIRSLEETRKLSDLNYGAGVETKIGEADLNIIAGGASVEVNLDSAETVGDVIDLINDAAGLAGVAIEARLAAVGNGIQIVDNTGGADPLRVERANYSYALDDLGLTDGVWDEVNLTFTGTNTNETRADNALTALYDLQRALEANDQDALSDAAERLTPAMDQIVEIQGQVGAESQGFQQRLSQMQDTYYATEELLSQVRDLDYTSAVTQWQAAQTALQASLMTGSQLMSLSLMDYM